MTKDMVQVRGTGRKSYEAPKVSIGRSQFNRSHGIKTAFDASYLIPIFCDEVLPGDTFTMSLNGFVRIFSPLDAPVMDNIEMETSFFFVPNRIVWENWENFMGSHDDAGAQDTDYTIPILADGIIVNHDNGVGAVDLMAFFGIPDGLQTTDVEINVLPFRGYNRIYNEWFRDQNVIDKVGQQEGNGPDAANGYGVFKTAKKHDYFTSCLPYLQKGDPISIATGVKAEIFVDIAETAEPGVWSTVEAAYRRMDAGAAQVDISATASSQANVLYADLAGATGLTINALRESVAIQRLLEKDARGGTRYVEIIKAHFGVTSPDFRLQRPEYLGGGKAMINVSPVANSSATATEDQGELRGIGTGVISGHAWAKSFVEHGYVIGLVRARGDITYFQGLDRMWSRQTRYDFYLPALAMLGEQSVLNKELFVSNVLATDDAVFGYQQRWEEYRTKKSMIVGVLNPDAAAALSHWHLAEDFSALPTLSQAFIEDATPMTRITTTTTQPDFLLDLWFNYKCARPMPINSVPSLTARF